LEVKESEENEKKHKERKRKDRIGEKRTTTERPTCMSKEAGLSLTTKEGGQNPQLKKDVNNYHQKQKSNITHASAQGKHNTDLDKLMGYS